MNKHILIILIVIAAVMLSSCGEKVSSADNKAIANPVITPPGGSYDLPVSVLIHCPNYDATIHYTTDGSDPGTNSSLYSSLLQINSNTVLKARAFKNGYISSAIVSQTYQFGSAAVDSVVISPRGGAFPGAQEVSLFCSTPNAQIYFTLDGSDPGQNSNRYIRPILISNSLTIKARAYAEGMIPSLVSSAFFSFQLPLPVFNLEDGDYVMPQMVSISHPYPSAVIRYTRDGSDPTEESELYQGALNVSSNTLLKARAYLENWQPSAVASAFYVISLADQMQLFPGGTFLNGSAYVQLSPYYVGRREVTELEWVYVMQDMQEIVPDRPKGDLTWMETISYCNYRSILEGFEPCYSYGNSGTSPINWPAYWFTDHSQVSCNWEANGYRLPTEMEWMYAARGGNVSNNYIYSGSSDIDGVAWYSGNASGPALAGLKLPNEMGLFDMSGNLWEFCWDIYHHEYPTTDTQNPTGPQSGFTRAMRGGCFSTDASNCTVAKRFYTLPTIGSDSHGFRVVRKF
ncbi:MAG: chitobiase/beta-hexosaminidase C-terminal domain-containing protein [Candidatus Cloacimonetes bacterium]|nr:chitobiase/beta-hexosaminidase C-terminal domain-containing protein [Candidatus Cloacimonadota bacterium]MDY0172737.1 chitobiase/beta-hexosaminidase C-terminal domain-containing protein [Candidatus Cloacimonadaceae bacterium]